jgi:acetylornithine deacetylase/succinyl-diaminopimelate desuccinylase-like protein
MRVAAVLLLGLTAAAASGAPPPATLSGAPKLPPPWEQTTREIFKTSVELPTVAGRGQVPVLADYLAGKLRAAGWSDRDLHLPRYEPVAGNPTAALIARWPAANPTGKKPILILAHLDVVEALPTDWDTDPFKLIERDGYLYGRGTNDNKQGAVGSLVALMKLRAAGFKPSRDIVLLFTGDEETMGHGAELGTTEWRKWTDAEFALNSDAGGGSFRPDGTPLGFGLQTSEKTYQSYSFRVRNPGGHSSRSRPRPDNAIYQLADALKKLEAHRFAPALNETTRAYFGERAAQEGNSPLGQAMRRWLADERDGAAADVIEASEVEVGQTRTRCVATMLKGGHADNALPQLAEATVNCRILPGVEPRFVQAELRRLVGLGVAVEPALFHGKASPASPLRADVVAAYTKAVRARFPEARIIPEMSTGATDGLLFRAAGISVYGVNGGWGVSPDDERAHGKDERIPVQSLWDSVFHWEMLIKELGGK